MTKTKKNQKVKKYSSFVFFAFWFLISLPDTWASPPGWTVNPAQYQYNMPGLFRVVKANNIFMNEAGAMVGVFVGNEIRGVVPANDIIFIGADAYFPATMYSNSQDGDTLTFKVYVPSLDSVFNAYETAIFDRDLTLGTPPSPFLLTISMCDGTLILSSMTITTAKFYKAGTEIIINGVIDIMNGGSLTLFSPNITCTNQIWVRPGGMAQLENDGCQ